MHKLILGLVLSATLPHMWADVLWIGNDNVAARPVLKTDLSGNQLGQANSVPTSGIAIDAASNLIYLGASSGGQVVVQDLSNLGVTVRTFYPGTRSGEDMAFDGSAIWRADYVLQSIQKIDPVTGTIVLSFNLGFFPIGVDGMEATYG